MEETLCRAASVGDVHKMHQVLRENSLVLDIILSGSFKMNPLHVAISRNQVEFVKELLRINKELASVPESGRSPLHVAISRNQVEIVKELLSCNPDLAEVLESGRSPLHVASAKGNLDIAKALVEASMKMCYARDNQGMNPVHVAAMEGKQEVLADLVRVCPQAAQVMLDQNETILHLCVKHGKLEPFMLLKENVASNLLNAKDKCGNTILHVAVSGQNIHIVQCVVNCGKLPKRQQLDVNVVNAQGHTALDMVQFLGNKNLEGCLWRAKCKKAKDTSWLPKNEILMVVTSLIATMAFQAVVAPPGGLWQDTNKDGDKAGKAVSEAPSGTNHVHNAGEAIMPTLPNIGDGLFNLFICINSIGFVASLSTLFWSLASNLRSENSFSKWFLVGITWLIITSIAITYGLYVVVITPEVTWGPLNNDILWGIIGWCFALAVGFLIHTLKLIKEARKYPKLKNVLLLVGCQDQDKGTNTFVQNAEANANTIPLDLRSHDNGSQKQGEIQMV